VAGETESRGFSTACTLPLLVCIAMQWMKLWLSMHCKCMKLKFLVSLFFPDDIDIEGANVEGVGWGLGEC
jgi:hypothetical protein